jgi:hypothetical protein
MAFLTIGGTSISVDAKTTPDRKKEEIGDRGRGVDGTMRQTIVARKRTWVVNTILMLAADADALEATIEGTQPVNCAGDLINATVSCFVMVSGRKATATRGSHLASLEITMMEV